MPQFDRDQNIFPSYVHRCIWTNGLLLVPPDIFMENIEPEQMEIFLDLYRYKSDMFSDMYQNPSHYLIDVCGIQEAMTGRDWYQAHLSAQWNKRKNQLNKLGEIEQTDLPHVICLQLLVYLKNGGDGYYLSRADYDKFFVGQSLRKCKYKIKEVEFLEILAGCGLSVVAKDDLVYFTNNKYPLMFAAIEKWQKLLEPHTKGKEKYAGIKQGAYNTF